VAQRGREGDDSPALIRKKASGINGTRPAAAINAAGKQLRVLGRASGEAVAVSGKQLGGELLLATATLRDVAMLQHFVSVSPCFLFSQNFERT
jgi:hypothetical protein